MDYSIGITTFEPRFNKFFRPLIENIRGFRPDVDIIVAINNLYGQRFSQRYRKDILNFLEGYDYMYPIFFSEMRGLSKMWNTILTISTNDNILMINDDIDIFNISFFSTLETEIQNVDGKHSFLINNSFSHCLLNKDEIITLGFFDERLLGFGEEDGDITYRYINIFGRPISKVSLPGITNIVDGSRDEGIKSGIAKYSKFNRQFMFDCFNDDPDLTNIDGPKYVPNNNSIAGMFDIGMHQRLPDISQYPYEQFYRKNRSKL